MKIAKNDIYEFLKNAGLPIIIYGMGNGADKVINQLYIRDILITGITASDDFVRGQNFHNFTVKKISDFENMFEDFIIITAFGSSRPEVMEHIFSLEKKYTVLALDVPVYGDNIFDMKFYEKNIEEIEKTYHLLADNQSKTVYENIINFKLTGKLRYLKESYSSKDEVFKNIICLGKNENYLDLGAYRGDTIEEFIHYSGGSYNDITALEPDIKTFMKLKENVSMMKNIKLFQMGIWDKDTDINFEDSLGRGSSIKNSGNKKLAVTKVDTLYAVKKLTYLKMDVEGAEKKAISGAANTIRRDKPKLNIAAYHRSEDIFRLPLLINSIMPDYKIYLRQHPYIPAWDLNIYAL